MSSSNSLEHLLFMKLKDPMPEEPFKRFLSKVEDIRKIPGVLDVSFGKNLETVRNGGYNYGYRVLLNDPSDLPVYADHPIHVELKDILNEIREAPPIVSDYLVPKVKK